MNDERINKIRIEMLLAKMNQEDLAKVLNLSRQTIAKILSGKRDLTITELETLAVFFKKDKHYFF